MTGKSRRIECQTSNITVYAKILKQGRYVLLAICDADLLGKTLREGKIVFEVGEAFYKGIQMSVDEAVDLVDQSTVVNMVGTHTVQEAMKRGLIHPEGILKIAGVPHAQIVKT